MREESGDVGGSGNWDELWQTADLHFSSKEEPFPYIPVKNSWS